MSHVCSTCLPIGNARHHQRQLPRLRVSPPVRRGIDQNVYTYARFSFNNSSNALSAHKKLWHSTFVFDCVCKMCEAIGRGRRQGWGMCKLWQCRQHSRWHLQIRPRPPLCRIHRWHINHRQNCLCVYVCVCWPKLHICLCVYMGVCVRVCLALKYLFCFALWPGHIEG